ncbi:PREDICTED: putative F-box protein At3g16590 [Camelina sativa]|uniref:F-box protein At3g16590 n=1 Tax=Camelina sativa TaxID=90675 RepID=A0ABM0WAR1_CAMSA|nr:PREDICTED: putative F-box protein At3g16590 [Camelina sativa]
MPKKLPAELEDEILYRVPPLSLARFRTVCKQWNQLYNDKRFINNHLACVRPQFILRTETSKIYSIGINLDDSLEVRELNLETHDQGPNKKLKLYRNMFYCDGFLLCPALPHVVAVWNPWLREQQTKWIEPKRNRFNLYGLGYDNGRPVKEYKILGLSYGFSQEVDGSDTKIDPRVSIYEFATNAWKDCKFGLLDWHLRSPRTVLSLNGTLYWIAKSLESDGCFIQSFDLSSERFKPFCFLPCKNDFGDTQILEVFRGDRISVLEQCKTTKKVKIWVTKNMISGDRKEIVSWRLLMTVSIPNFPRLQNHTRCNSQPSYFIDNNDDKRLIVCTCDEIGKPWVYIVKGDRFKKIQMGFEVDPWPFHLVYVPSLVPIPLFQEQRE